MSIVSTVEGRRGSEEENLHLSGQLNHHLVQGPRYYHVWACWLMPWLSRSEPFSVDSMDKQSRVQPCHGQATFPPLVAAAFPTLGVAGSQGVRSSRNLGLAGRP